MRIKRNKTHQKTKRRIKKEKERERDSSPLEDDDCKKRTFRRRLFYACAQQFGKMDDVIQKLINSFSYSGPGLRVCGLKEDVKMATPQVDDKGDVVLMDASSKEVKWDPFQSPDWDLEKPTSEAIVRIKRYFLL